MRPRPPGVRPPNGPSGQSRTGPDPIKKNAKEDSVARRSRATTLNLGRAVLFLQRAPTLPVCVERQPRLPPSVVATATPRAASPPSRASTRPPPTSAQCLAPSASPLPRHALQSTICTNPPDFPGISLTNTVYFDPKSVPQSTGGGGTPLHPTSSSPTAPTPRPVRCPRFPTFTPFAPVPIPRLVP